MKSLLYKASKDEYIHDGLVNQRYSRLMLAIIKEIYDSLGEEETNIRNEEYRLSCLKMIRIISLCETKNLMTTTNIRGSKNFVYTFRLELYGLALINSPSERTMNAIRDLKNVSNMRTNNNKIRDLDLAIAMALKSEENKYQITTERYVEIIELSKMNIEKEDIL